ncbi:MAG: TPM domain-containing protein [Mobilitalea sp.]
MKKFCFLLLISLFLAGMPRIIVNADTLEPTKEFYVNDYAEVISVEVEDEIIDLGYQLEKQTGAQIVLVTVDFTNGDSLETYAMDLFNDWGIGSAEKNDGLLILLSIGDDDYWVTQGEGLEDTLTSGKISSILQKYLEPDFAAKDYSAGAKKTYEAFVKELNGQLENVSGGSDTGVIKKADKYTYDHANIISKEDEEYINQKSTESKEKYNAGFYVVTRDYSEDGLSAQQDTINTFERLKAKGRDIVLVLYKEDDDYWVLPGLESEKFVTEGVLNNILDNVLEPEFIEKHYSLGAVYTANSFYNLFQTNYEDLTKIKVDVSNNGNTAVNENVPVLNDNNFNTTEDNAKVNMNETHVGFAILVIIILIVITRRRRRFRRDFGVPFNPYSRKYVRIYGPGGYWGPHGYPHGGHHNGGYHNNRYQNSGRQYNSDEDDDDRGRGRSSTGGSFWGSSGGAGRSSSTRSSSSSGSSSSSSYSGGGAGRSSGGGSSSSGHSSGGGRASSSGGGGRSRGGGAGRNR